MNLIAHPPWTRSPFSDRHPIFFKLSYLRHSLFCCSLRSTAMHHPTRPNRFTLLLINRGSIISNRRRSLKCFGLPRQHSNFSSQAPHNSDLLWTSIIISQHLLSWSIRCLSQHITRYAATSTILMSAFLRSAHLERAAHHREFSVASASPITTNSQKRSIILLKCRARVFVLLKQGYC